MVVVAGLGTCSKLWAGGVAVGVWSFAPHVQPRPAVAPSRVRQGFGRPLWLRRFQSKASSSLRHVMIYTRREEKIIDSREEKRGNRRASPMFFSVSVYVSIEGGKLQLTSYT